MKKIRFAITSNDKDLMDDRGINGMVFPERPSK